jgi:hypothetical protein
MRQALDTRIDDDNDTISDWSTRRCDVTRSAL